jgi:hypothetical protein
VGTPSPPHTQSHYLFKVKKIEMFDGPDMNKSEWIKLEFFMDSDNPAFNYSHQFANFKNGSSEEWIKWVMTFHEIENLIPLKEAADKTLLKDQVMYIKNHLRRRLKEEDTVLLDNELIELVLWKVGL